MKIAVGTDSSSGISQEEAKSLGIFVVPLPFIIDGREYEDGIDINYAGLFEIMRDDPSFSTSQPAPQKLLDLWDKALEDADELVYIPMTRTLSSSCQAAKLLAEDYGGRVEVVDNLGISVTERQAVLSAIKLAEKGYTAKEIRQILEKEQYDNSIYITVGTLKNLKEGGRITPAIAAIGTLLKIKPVLSLFGTDLELYSRERTFRQAKETMLNALARDLTDRFNDPEAEHCRLYVADTTDVEAAPELEEELRRRYPKAIEVYRTKLPVIIDCHIGPGAVGIAACKIILPELADDTQPDRDVTLDTLKERFSTKN